MRASDAMPLHGVPRKRHVRELYSPDQVCAVLRRERARSDRQHCGFSIVLFRLEGRSVSERTRMRLATVLLRLIRETDELGRYDTYTFCAVLPDTDPVGASILIARVRNATRGKGYEPTCDIYTYPDPALVPTPTSRGGGGDDDTNYGGGSGGRRMIDGVPTRMPMDRPGGRMDLRPGGDRAAMLEGLGKPRQGDLPNDTGGVDGSGGGGGALAVLEAPAVAVDPLEQAPLPEPAPITAPAFEFELLPARPMSALFAEPLPWWKRVLDVTVAAATILMTSPIMIAAAVAIRLSSRGPVIFRQHRTGLGGRPFMIYKFRTMCMDAERKQAALKALSEQDGPAFKLTNDPRVFAVGRFLRKTSIDELPQLFNVLKGDMTLVGPRPLPVHEADACVQWQQRRHDVTPGLTCIWQVEGRSRVKFEEWMRMDMRYARRRSILSDVKLVMKTIPAVLLRRGAN